MDAPDVIESYALAVSLGYAVRIFLEGPDRQGPVSVTIYGYGEPSGSTVPCFQASSGVHDELGAAIQAAIAAVPEARNRASRRGALPSSESAPKMAKAKVIGSADDVLKLLGL